MLDIHVPLKEAKFRPQNEKPWINGKIISKIKEKHKIYQKYAKTQDLEHLKRFKIVRNNLNHEIRRSKYNYFKSFFEQNNQNIKKHW